MTTEPAIILLSGMGADARVFARQLEALPAATVPAWLEPRASETLKQYAARFAREIDPGVPCFVGGASFGGFVAVEMVRHMRRPLGCFLIGSVRAPEELPPSLRALRGAVPSASGLPFEIVQRMAAFAAWSAGGRVGRHRRALLEQFVDADAAFLRWACGAVLTWEAPVETGGVPIFQIHGGRDRVLPPRYTAPDVIVAGAGHALSMSHPDEVTRFIVEQTTRFSHLRRCENTESGTGLTV